MSEVEPDAVVKEWRFGSRNTSLMVGMGLAVSTISLPGFFWLSGLFRPDAISLSGQPEDLPLVLLAALGIIALVLTLLVIHEWCHGLGFRAAGARPRYGAKWVTWYFPVFYASGPGHWMTKRQYVVLLLAPTMAINLLGVGLFAALGSLNWIMVFPLSMHLGACIGDWWMVLVILRLWPSTIEDTAEGFRYR